MYANRKSRRTAVNTAVSNKTMYSMDVTKVIMTTF